MTKRRLPAFGEPYTANLRTERTAIAELELAPTEEERLSEIERRLGILAEEVENLKVGEAMPTAVGGETIPGLAPAAAKVYRTDHGLSIGGYGEALVEIFDGSLADRSPIYAEGNVLISMRTINTIAIVDPRTRDVLWAWGPTNLHRQHHRVENLLPPNLRLRFQNLSS